MGQLIVYVALEATQTSYNSSGFTNIIGYTLYENINLSSTVADAYVGDSFNLYVYTASAGVIGSFVVGC